MSIGSYSEQKRNSGMLTIQPSAVHIRAFEDFAKLLPKAAAAAERRAINKTLGRLRTYIARAVGKQERIAIGAVRQRLRAFPVSGGAMRGKLWFGLNAMEASRAGAVRQTGHGVSVAGRRFQGAFYQKVYGNKADIWIRTASKHFSAEDYPDAEQGRRRSGFVEEGGNRFPLAKAKVSLEQARPHFDHWIKQADEILLGILKQELNFELQKYLKGAVNV